MSGSGGPVGEIAKVSGGNPPVVEMTQPHGLEDGTLVRIRSGPSCITAHAKPDPQDGNLFRLYHDREMRQAADLAGIGSRATVDRLNSEDWSIIVGINYYPGVTNLQGPRLDSTLFKRWVENAGFVPPDHIYCIQSPTDPPTSIDQAVPTEGKISEAFEKLIKTAAKDRAHYLGRRLYVFFSGHGIVPLQGSRPEFREAALLTAEAEFPVYKHVAARAWAEWFRAMGIFDEVLLFADCCRDREDNVRVTQPLYPQWSQLRPEGRQFYAFSTRLASQAWEQSLGMPPQVRGVMSFVVDQALKNGRSTTRTGS